MDWIIGLIIGMVCGGWIFIAAIVLAIKGRVEDARSADDYPRWTAYDKMVDNGYDGGSGYDPHIHSGYDSGSGYDGGGGGDGGGC